MSLPAWFLEQTKQREGFKDKAYWDYGQYSIGYGSKAKSPNETIDLAEANRRLLGEMAEARRQVDGMVPPDAPEGARLALTSLTHNAGPKWMKSGLGDYVREGNWPAAAARLQMYTKAGGVERKGLVTRRAAEAELMLQGVPPRPPESIPSPQQTAMLPSTLTPLR